MRFRKIKEVVKLLFLFFERNVFNIGILKSRIFKCFLIFVLLAVIAGVSFLMLQFFNMNESTIEQTRIVLDAYTCTIFMWTFIAFIFIKVLFLKKNKFKLFTQQLPVIKREMDIAVLVFELLFSFLIIIVISSSIILAILIRDGFIFFPRLLCNILFINITIYLMLEFGYSVLNFVFNFFNLAKIKNVLIICLFCILTAVFYIVVIPDIFSDIIYGYIDSMPTNNYLFYTVIYEKYGILSATFVFVLITGVLLSLILIIPNNDTVAPNDCLLLFRQRRKPSIFKCYLFSFIRRVDVFTYYCTALFLFLLLIIGKSERAYFSITILTINGMYAYIQSENIRYMLNIKKYKVLEDYIYLVFGQFIYISILSIPVLLINIFIFKNIGSCLMLFPIILVSIILFTMVGIIFPAKNENPFSAFLGISILILISISLIIIFFVLKLSQVAMLLIFGAILLLSIYLSLLGLKRLNQVKRNMQMKYKNECM